MSAKHVQPIAALYATGHSNRQIAAALGLTVSQVENTIRLARRNGAWPQTLQKHAFAGEPIAELPNGQRVSLRHVRRVWVAVTARPNASLKELACTLGIAHSTTQCALQVLWRAGYITHMRGAARARRIVVPFVEMRQ